MNVRGRIVVLLAAALPSGALAACSAQAAPTAETPAELFGSRCIGCHVPPDPRFAVDRAWLDQVRDTA